MQPFSADDLTLQELAEVERIAGAGIAALADPAAPKGKFFAAMHYQMAKRSNTDAKLADSYALPMRTVLADLGMADGPADPDPTPTPPPTG